MGRKAGEVGTLPSDIQCHYAHEEEAQVGAGPLLGIQLKQEKQPGCHRKLERSRRSTPIVCHTKVKRHAHGETHVGAKQLRPLGRAQVRCTTRESQR